MRTLAILFALSPALALAQTSSEADSLLARQLSHRAEADQAGRGLITLALRQGRQPDAADGAFALAIDSLNTAWLKGVVAERGWPKASEVGEQGASDAWLLVQHADRDRAFQREVLGLMEAAFAEGEASGSDFAYLTDRVRVGAGEPQVYGTQMNVVDGVPEPRELEDPDGVDARRAAVGLQPLAESLESFRQRIRGGAASDETEDEQTP